MQRIKLETFKGYFGKGLTGNEIEFILALARLQDNSGKVYGVHYQEIIRETGMSAQAFYDCKESLQKKNIIHADKVLNDYDITLIGNDFTQYTEEDYRLGQVSYLKINCKLFSDLNWKKLKPAQKLLVMDLFNINNAGGRTYRIGRDKFIEKYANGIDPDGSERKGLLNVSERTLQKYMKMLKLYFYVGIKDGMYLITLRSHFAESAVLSENSVASQHTLNTACRRNKIKVQDKAEVKGIIRLLSKYQEDLFVGSVYIPDIFAKMLEVINQRISNIKKWKRYLKASLFHKLLKEEYIAS